MNTLLRTSAILFGLLIGITAVSAAPIVDEVDNFNTEEFWAEMAQGD